MEMNLMRFAHQKRLNQQLKKMLHLKQANLLRTFLFQYFPNQSLQGANDDLILEMGDVIASLAEVNEEPNHGLHTELQLLKSSILNLKQHVYQNKQSVTRQYQQMHFHTRKIPISLSPQQASQMTASQKQQFLQQLDIDELYQSYQHGYHQEQIELYDWMIGLIDESLHQRVHSTQRLTDN